MTIILCPTRGGEASYPNQDRAIAIARERQADILFLYVSNVRFLDRFASPLLVDIEKELDELGEFMLAMAQERAERAGVKAEAEIRHGVFRQALKEVILERQIALVVMGTATGETGMTTRPYLEELADWICTETGAEVILVSGEQTTRTDCD
jgi:nucleotide-binding universal stress UspA family protein